MNSDKICQYSPTGKCKWVNKVLDCAKEKNCIMPKEENNFKRKIITK
jgi:hypothetical protein